MSDNLIRQLMEQVGMPNSTSLFCAIQQAENSGFQAGAASRDAEVARLEQTIAFQKAAWTTDYEERDQLREQVALLREALKDICSDYEDRFDMGSPSTNPGMKFVVKQAREALAATEPKP